MGGMAPVPGSGQYLGWKSCAHRTPPGPVPVRGGRALTGDLDESAPSGVAEKIAEVARCRNRGCAIFAKEGFLSNSSFLIKLLNRRLLRIVDRIKILSDNIKQLAHALLLM